MGPKFDPNEVKFVYLRAVGGEVGATSSLALNIKELVCWSAALAVSFFLLRFDRLSLAPSSLRGSRIAGFRT